MKRGNLFNLCLLSPKNTENLQSNTLQLENWINRKKTYRFTMNQTTIKRPKAVGQIVQL